MVDKNMQTIEFPKTPNRQQFVNFVKTKFSAEDLIQEEWDTIDETQMRTRVAESIYNLLFIQKVDVSNQLIATLLLNGNHILEEIKQEYPELWDFMRKVQSITSKNLFLNNDITPKAEIAKEKGLEPLAKILAKRDLNKEQVEEETKKFLGQTENQQEVKEAIRGVKHILIANTLSQPQEIKSLRQDRNKANTVLARDKILSFQKESLFDMLSQKPKDIYENMIRKPFLSYIQEVYWPEDVKFIQENFTTVRDIEPKIQLLTEKDINYAIFEDKYVEIFYTFTSSISWPFSWYIIQPKEEVNKVASRENTTRNIERKWSIESKTPLQYRWDNFVGDKIKETTKDLALRGKNIYIEGNLWSGKSHLLQGLAKELHQVKPHEDIIYMTWLEFYNEYQQYSSEYRKNKAIEDKDKAKEQSKENSRIIKKERKEYTPSFTDRFINRILIINGIDPIFSGNRLRSQETLLTALVSAKQTFISGRQSILKFTIPRETGPIKLSDEINNLELLEIPEQKEQIKKAMINNILDEFSDLFTENLPLDGIKNILIDHIPPNDYRMILSWYLRAVDLWDPIDIKTYIEKKLDKRDGLKLPPEDIINSIHELLVCDDDIRKCIKENIPWIILSEIDGARPQELLEKIENNNIRSESTLWLFMELITYFITHEHPEFTQAQVGKIIGKPASWAIFRTAERRKASNKRLFEKLEKWLTQVLYKKYGISKKK